MRISLIITLFLFAFFWFFFLIRSWIKRRRNGIPWINGRMTIFQKAILLFSSLIAGGIILAISEIYTKGIIWIW
ncbi:hypothetical protein [Mesomycoplasma molare]|uniref:Uncharacterized protein n=1 Tax=Mesomycoplasma molare TaxID=171288 RepID=A0ABY5TWX3_9BACT|nr:hypothetical protein [Mesomycoplasma molare]UWD34486.1 hypothetical protein NX772_01490 [Mesomycoplasma molare]